MKTETSTPFQSIDVTQLDAVVGGCSCGCGQPNCSGATGSQAAAVPGAATFPGAPTAQRPLLLGR